jgi:hypothetical protein
MIFTDPGAVIASLTVGGESHLDGWTFNLTGNGKHDHLFTIVDNKLLAGIEYVYPGNKEIEVIYQNSSGAGRTATMPVLIKDYGSELIPDHYLTIEAGELPKPTGKVWFTMSWYDDVTSGGSPLLTVGDKVIAKVESDGTFKLFDDNGLQVYTSNLVKYVPRRWHTLFVERVPHAGSYIWRWKIGEEVVYETTNPLHMDTIDVNDIHLIRRNGVGSGNMYMTNVKFIHENIVYIREELHVGNGELIESDANITYNHLKQQV